MKISSPEPCVGIFWHFQRRLIIDSTPLSHAEPYGEDCLTHPTGHYDYWTLLQESEEVSKDIEYEEPARGRVLFQKRRDRFLLLADRCILNRRDLVSRIMARMHLPPQKTDVDSDPHYVCFRCLARSRRRSS